MLHFCQNSFICMVMILIPTVVIASRPYENADAVITLRNGNPCFSYPQEEETRKRPYSFGSLSVSKSLGGVMWEIGIASPDRKGLLKPNSSETCIEYSILPPGTKLIKPAEILETDKAYTALLSIDIPGEGLLYMRNYLSNFCIIHNEKREKIVVGATFDDNGPWRCLKPGESPKRGFWQRLLGR